MDSKSSEGNIKFTIYDGYFSANVIGTFYVPATTKDRFGWIPADIIKARMQRDFNVTFDHYSLTTG